MAFGPHPSARQPARTLQGWTVLRSGHTPVGDGVGVMVATGGLCVCSGSFLLASQPEPVCSVPFSR